MMFQLNFSMINNTHRGKTVFYSVQYKNGCLAASDLFDLFKQSTKFYTIYYNVLRVQMFENCDSSNRQLKWMVAPFGKFYGKTWVGFSLNTEKCFFLEVSF